jgi:uncharacterized iron-regulated membrane protein
LLGDRGDPYKEGFNGLMFDLHVYLLSGEIGLTDEIGIKIVGAVGIALFIILLTGVYLWWPGLRRWASGFKVRFRRERYVRNNDYHKVVGIVAVPVLALIALTGVAFGFHETSKSVWYAVTFTEPPPEFPEEPPEAEPTGTPPLTLDELADRAAAVTDATPTRIHPPKGETGTVQVALSTSYDPQAGYDGVDGNVNVWVNPYTGEVALERDPREMPLAAKIFENWLFPLHVGSFGRTPVHVLYALVGLAPLVLAITGLTMWLLKRASRRRKA